METSRYKVCNFFAARNMKKPFFQLVDGTDLQFEFYMCNNDKPCLLVTTN